MAIVLDNQVAKWRGSSRRFATRGEITGGFTQEQADDLSLMLRTGSLPASISTWRRGR